MSSRADSGQQSEIRTSSDRARAGRSLRGRYAIARRTAGGTGASFPLIARQRISLSSKSSILSYSSKSILQ